MKKDQKSFRYQDLLLDGYVLKKTIEIDDPFASCYQLSRENIISILQENSSIASTRESKKVNERIHNIISFMGARGTGKTSVMFSFLENLKSGSCSSMTPMAPELERTEFIVLSPIDAEILRYHEDIMEIVLARMPNNILAVRKKQIIFRNHFGICTEGSIQHSRTCDIYGQIRRNPWKLVNQHFMY